MDFWLEQQIISICIKKYIFKQLAQNLLFKDLHYFVLVTAVVQSTKIIGGQPAEYEGQFGFQVHKFFF